MHSYFEMHFYFIPPYTRTRIKSKSGRSFEWRRGVRECYGHICNLRDNSDSTPFQADNSIDQNHIDN